MEKKVIFERLSSKHITQGWLDWVSKIDSEGFTEFSRHAPNREKLESIILSPKEDSIWLAAYTNLIRTSGEYTYFGNAHISDISWIDRRCTFGRLIGDERLRGSGIGTLLTESILSYCFNVLGMNKVTAGCLANNMSAIKSNLKAGMVEEAILKRDRFCNGRFVDTHLFAAWSETWRLQDGGDS